MNRLPVLLIALCALIAFPASSQSDPNEPIRSNRLGITHISTSTEITPEARYQQALALGAGWNRWPLYWDRVETEPNTWDWSAFDRQVKEDMAHGLQIDAILIGRPEFYAERNRISGLHEPIFADLTDIPGPNKQINPANPWAVFVQEAVRRYRPGGLLTQWGELPETDGIRVWEIWNEPDFSPFWKASFNDYARLLKTAYLVIKQEDPLAQVMFGGLLYPSENNWLAQILRIYSDDSMAELYNWYIDIVGIHNYGDPWRSGWLTLYVRQTLRSYGLQRPIWLNETGVPVWDDYPGPTWEPTSTARATAEQQAWFFIQSAVFAWSEGADKVFYHQLYDDCGDQPAGTDFPPHNGQLCRGDGSSCWGDAFGIYRNLTGSVCFSQSPEPGTARPVARAFRLVAEVFGTQPFQKGHRVFEDPRAITVTFERPLSGERISVMWNRSVEPVLLEWQAVGTNAQMLSLDEDLVVEPNEQGFYTMILPPALEDVDDTSDPAGGKAIGGSPYILIERTGTNVLPVLVNLDLPDVEARESGASVAAEPSPVPTVNPAFDTQPPVAYVIDLPETSPATFTVSWRGADDSGIDYYLVWVRVDGGTWLPWLETPETSADYTGISGSTYEFSVWAVDLAGNWTPGTDILPQAITRVE